MDSVRHLTGLILLCFAATALATEADCYRAVQDGVYSRVVTACLELPHRDRMATLSALSSGTYTHHLGTLDKPSRAFALLHAYADSGDMDAQYMYGLLTSMVHVKSVERWAAENAADPSFDMVALNQHNERVRDESARWIEMAAKKGHTLAMLEAAENLVRKSYSDPKTDLGAALAYAQQAKDNNSRLAVHMIERIEKRMRELSY